MTGCFVSLQTCFDILIIYHNFDSCQSLYVRRPQALTVILQNPEGYQREFYFYRQRKIRDNQNTAANVRIEGIPMFSYVLQSFNANPPSLSPQH